MQHISCLLPLVLQMLTALDTPVYVIISITMAQVSPLIMADGTQTSPRGMLSTATQVTLG